MWTAYIPGHRDADVDPGQIQGIPGPVVAFGDRYLVEEILGTTILVANYDIGSILMLVVIFVMIFVVQMFYENRKLQPWSAVLESTKQRH
jgi:hypothetical protein